MEWLLGLGLLVVALVLLWVQSFGSSEDPGADDNPDTRPYQWGDELHEYSYRHPWDDEL